MEKDRQNQDRNLVLDCLYCLIYGFDAFLYSIGNRKSDKLNDKFFVNNHNLSLSCFLHVVFHIEKNKR